MYLTRQSPKHGRTSGSHRPTQGSSNHHKIARNLQKTNLKNNPIGKSKLALKKKPDFSCPMGVGAFGLLVRSNRGSITTSLQQNRKKNSQPIFLLFVQNTF